MKAALFLDRDGVINVDRHYVWRIEDFEFMPGIFELVEAAVQGGLLPLVVTNQAGIGRGYYAEEDFRRLDDWMHAQFRDRGAAIARTYHCPYHPTEGIGVYRRESFDRKPNPGMILRAKADFDIDLSNSVLVGDKDSDAIVAAQWRVGRAGIAEVPQDRAAAAGVGFRIIDHHLQLAIFVLAACAYLRGHRLQLILDERLLSKPYGRTVLASLPPFSRTREEAVARAFFGG